MSADDHNGRVPWKWTQKLAKNGVKNAKFEIVKISPILSNDRLLKMVQDKLRIAHH